MLRFTMVLLVFLIAQTAYGQSDSERVVRRIDSTIRADSIARAKDSILSASLAAVARDSTLVEEFEKIVAIYKGRRQFALELQAATRMASANPSSAVASYLLGDAELDNSYPERAISPLKRVLILVPTYVRARVALAEAYEMLEKIDTAIFHLDTALTQNPRHAQAYLQRAKLLTRTGRNVEAASDFREASALLSNSPDAFDAWYKFAQALIRIREFEEAADALTYCMTLRPESADALFMLAEANEALGRTDRARQSYEQFLYRFPRHPRALEAERNARAIGWRP